MARQAVLGWDEQRNKWRVVYGGKKYRFDGGSGKSDREAKRRAESEWKRIKADCDHQGEQSKPHRVEYEKVIAEWTSVLAWSMEHGEQTTVAVAQAKLASLEERLALRVPPPLDWADRFLPGAPPDHELNERMAPVYRAAGMMPVTVMTGPADGQKPKWDDRLVSRDKRVGNVETEHALCANVEQFVTRKRNDAEAGQLSAGRVETIRLHLDLLMKFAGRTSDVASINHKFTSDFRDHLVERIRAEQMTAVYARDVFRSFKLFVRWLVNHTDKLPNLPKNIDERSLAISVGHQEAKVLSTAAIHTLLKKATDRTQLYILLGLNAALTQKDVSDLRMDEVDWSKGTITRKRSKTRDCKNVPTITYQLWPETLRLLREQRASKGDRVLLNEAGRALKTETFRGSGKFTKQDAARSALRRLAKLAKIEFSMKALKKTGASLIRGNASYRGLESLYLDHAPTSVADRFYTKPPQELLDEAIEWLGGELGLLGRLADLPDAPSDSTPTTKLDGHEHEIAAVGDGAKRKRKTNRTPTKSA